MTNNGSGEAPPAYATSVTDAPPAYPQLQQQPVQQQQQPQGAQYAYAPQQAQQPQQMMVVGGQPPPQQPVVYQPHPQQQYVVQQQPQQYYQPQPQPQPVYQQQQQYVGGQNHVQMTPMGQTNNPNLMPLADGERAQTGGNPNVAQGIAVQNGNGMPMNARHVAAKDDAWRAGCCAVRNVWLFFVLCILVARILNMGANPYYVTWWNILLLIGDIVFTIIAFIAGCRYSLKWSKPYYPWIIVEFVVSVALFAWILSDSYQDWCDKEYCANYDEDTDTDCEDRCYYSRAETTYYYVIDFLLILLAFAYFRKFRNRLIASGQK